MQRKYKRPFMQFVKKADKPLKLTIEDAATLLRVLSNKRLILLSTLLRSGPTCILTLSKTLHRNYKNVHTDVKLLREAGLIKLDHNEKIFVPWKKIHTEIDLLSAA